MKHLALSITSLPPRFPGLFIFCCWLGYRLDPDWLWAYTIAAILRWCLYATALHNTEHFDIFKEWRK
jgi:hypothetical protein